MEGKASNRTQNQKLKRHQEPKPLLSAPLLSEYRFLLLYTEERMPLPSLPWRCILSFEEMWELKFDVKMQQYQERSDYEIVFPWLLIGTYQIESTYGESNF